MGRKASFFLSQTIIGAVLWTFAVFMMLPLLWMVSSSLKYNIEIFAFPVDWIPDRPTLQAYRALLDRSYNFPLFYLNTLYVAVMVCLGIVIVGSLSGYAFAKIRFVGRDFIFMLKIAAIAIPFQVTMVPVFIMFGKMGLMDTLTSQWISAFLGPVFAIFLLRQFFKTVPDEIVESAKMDGASHFRICWQICVPMAVPVLVTLIIISFVGSWNAYEPALLFIRSRENYVISLAVKIFQREYFTDYAATMATTVVSNIPMIVALILGQKYMLRGLMVGAVKG